MSDQDDASRIEFTLAKKAISLGNGKCPMCSHDKWMVLNQPGELIGPVSKKDGFPVNEMVSSVAIACAKCGFISLHSISILRGDGDA